MCKLDTIKKLPTGISGLDQLFYEGIQLHNNSDTNANGIVIAIYGGKGLHKTFFGLQLMHGLAKSLYNAGIEKDLMPKFYSFNKSNDDLCNMYLDMVLTQTIENIIKENLVRDKSSTKPWQSKAFASRFFNTNGDLEMSIQTGESPKTPDDLTKSIDKYIAERIVYYNTRTKALHFKHIDPTDSKVNLLYRRRFSSVAKYFEKNVLNINSEDDKIFCKNFINISFEGSQVANDAPYMDKTSSLRCAEVIEELDKAVHEKEAKLYIHPVVLIDGFSDICDENLKKIPYTKLVATIRKIAPVSILIYDERFSDIKCDADIIIEMRRKEDLDEEYTYCELSIVKSLLQPVAFGWHQYKKRNYGIDVFPSLHRILQKRDYLTYLSHSVQNGIFDESYDEYLRMHHVSGKQCNYGDYSEQKKGVIDKYFKSMYPHLYKDKCERTGECNEIVEYKEILNDILFERKNEFPKIHRYSTALIGNPNNFKRLLYTAKIFQAALREEHSLVLLFDKDINSIRKQMLCPYLSHCCKDKEDLKSKNIDLKECENCYKYIHFFGVRMGCISAEELFAVLEQQLYLAEKAGHTIKHLIVDDLQKIDYSFPFLKKTSLFLSTMVEFCRVKDIALTILCDKKASLVHELCTLADNVVCIKRDSNKDDTSGDKQHKNCSLYLERNAYQKNPSEIIRYDIEDITTLFKCERECEKHDKKILSLQYDNNVKAEIISTMKEFWRQTVNINDISKCDK